MHHFEWAIKNGHDVVVEERPCGLKIVSLKEGEQIDSEFLVRL
jgi:hypothetical protein